MHQDCLTLLKHRSMRFRKRYNPLLKVSVCFALLRSRMIGTADIQPVRNVAYRLRIGTYFLSERAGNSPKETATCTAAASMRTNPCRRCCGANAYSTSPPASSPRVMIPCSVAWPPEEPRTLPIDQLRLARNRIAGREPAALSSPGSRSHGWGGCPAD